MEVHLHTARTRHCVFFLGFFFVSEGAGLSGGNYRPAAEWNTMCATSGWTFLLAPRSSEVIHAALILTVMPLSRGAVAPSGPPRRCLWPPRQCALHLSCQRRHVVDDGRVGVAWEEASGPGSDDLCGTWGRETLIKCLGITTFWVLQDFSCTPFTPAGFWGWFNVGSAWRSRGALYYFSNAAATKKTK